MDIHESLSVTVDDDWAWIPIHIFSSTSAAPDSSIPNWDIGGPSDLIQVSHLTWESPSVAPGFSSSLNAPLTSIYNSWELPHDLCLPTDTLAPSLLSPFGPSNSNPSLTFSAEVTAGSLLIEASARSSGESSTKQLGGYSSVVPTSRKQNYFLESEISRRMDVLRDAIKDNTAQLSESRFLEDILTIPHEQTILENRLESLQRTLDAPSLGGIYVSDMGQYSVKQARSITYTEHTPRKDNFFALLARSPVIRYLEDACKLSPTQSFVNGILRTILEDFEKGNPRAVEHRLQQELPNHQHKISQLLLKHNVPIECRDDEDAHVICARGVRAMFEMFKKWSTLGSKIRFAPTKRVSDEVHNLVSSFEKISSLVGTDRVFQAQSPPRLKLVRLISRLSTSFALTQLSDILQAANIIDDKYAAFCEALLQSGDINEIILELRECVKAEMTRLVKVNTEFKALRAEYEDVQDALSQEMDSLANAARVSGFDEGVSTREEAQIIHNKLSEVDERLEALQVGLGDYAGALSQLLDALDDPSSDQPRNVPPDPPEATSFALEENASSLVSCLGDVSSAVYASRAPKKLDSLGGILTNEAVRLRTRCVQVVPDLSHTLSSVQMPAANQPNSWWGRFQRKREVKNLENVVTSLFKGYYKLANRFRSYKYSICLFLWFASSDAAEKRAGNRMAALSETAWSHSHNLSPYLRPLDFAFSDIIQGLEDLRATIAAFHSQ
ncbi:hypothetical protein MIND_00773500 [Mycena indigotica]|uniref:Uncharacterized protein n=1 Tax=Mycena indigotica TaxID=2126181 RepID=A0A8H6SLZ5_9AGAR|nr:uncharacterized protein MIND_00773500 [Mycena indigotica]KAF7302068.1 hypothetical protein MIND_00773500 [Mycena indigotica]